MIGRISVERREERDIFKWSVPVSIFRASQDLSVYLLRFILEMCENTMINIVTHS